MHFIIGLGSATLLQLAFRGESDPIIPWENSHGDNKMYKMQKTKDKIVMLYCVEVK